ncbi:MAG TPA: polyprenyl diphosphate synthase [Candidatus Paceibacterota bacterium]
MDKRLEIFVSGRVQGVFYRASAKRVADSCGLVGFARNLPNGKVEIVAEATGDGGEAALRKLLDWCYRGSLLAHVDGLSFNWSEATGEFDKFQVSRDDGSMVVDQVHALTNLGRRVLNRVDRKVEKTILKIPKHVVIIPDGNRRWAKERGLMVWQGHKEGIERTKELLKFIKDTEVEHITFWGFSTENWTRSADEVAWLMKAFTQAVKDLGKELVKDKISFRHLGRKDRLDPKLASGLADLEKQTAQFAGKTFSMALDYGGRDEIIRAAQKASKNGGVSEESINEALDTAGLPDPDLIIRTSGEQRLSGMMPWQGVYAELYFTPLHFPDFTPDQMQLALAEYGNRNRTFGGS